MGFAAVLANLGQIRRNFRIAEQALLDEKPDALILIDYPSFNLRIAKFCRTHLPNTKIYYYIPPKVWAWKKRRIHEIAALCDEVLGIFPFEPAFYAQYGYSCTYVGNPTAEEILQRSGLTAKRSNSETVLQRSGLNSIAILPGSRPSEISHCLTKMLDAARQYPDYRIVVCAAPGIDDAFYAPYLRAVARGVADDLGIEIDEGVYCGVLGPTFETKAEANMMRVMGVSYVGMSTANEVIMARALGMNVLGLTLAANESGADTVTHEEVLQKAAAKADDFERLVRGIIHML